MQRPSLHVPSHADTRAAIEAATDRARVAVTKALEPMSPYLDASPKGFDAVCLAAMLRVYADVIEAGFGEGNAMGPLKTMVDEVRSRTLRAIQGGKR